MRARTDRRTSATFRQDSIASDALRERDPDNRLLARGPSFVLPAAQHRDLVLQHAGMLATGERSKGDTQSDRPLRSIFAVRHHPNPLPVPEWPADPDSIRERCEVDYRRALPVPAPPELTERELLVASRTIATRLVNESEHDAERLESLFLLLNARPMTAAEEQELTAWVAGHRSRFDPEDRGAPQLVQPGQDPDVDRLGLATWTTVVRMLVGTQSSMH